MRGCNVDTIHTMSVMVFIRGVDVSGYMYHTYAKTNQFMGKGHV